MTDQSQVLKVVLIGDGGVGKSSLMNRYITGKYDGQSYHTIGVEFLNKNITLENKKYTLQIWDTAGQERFKSLRTPFYRGADCCLLVYAVDDEQSFHNLDLWKKEFLFYSNIEDRSFPFIVLANKCDVDPADRQVSEDQAKLWCQQNGGYPHISTSAKDSTNVDTCFETAVRKTAVSQLHTGEASISNLTSGTPSVNLKTMAATNRSSGCC
uniref:ras-related protein Rab-9B-like n=1 Tax=Styela clava TaxID=7725 RepID=UPI00193A0666|nr:ras-related protein Rab-9B-like [Styela clava]